MLQSIPRPLAAAVLVLAIALAPVRGAGAADTVRLDAVRLDHVLGLARIDGRSLTADQLRGRAVLVSFFASWCPPCNAEFEHMKLLHTAHAAEGLTVVAINLFEDFSGFSDDGRRLKRFLDRHQPVFSIVKGTDETARLFGDVKRIPTVFVFDRQGRARLHFVHAEGADKTNPGLQELRGAVRNALGQSAAGLSPLLPESPVSVTKPSHSIQLTESSR